MEYQDYNSALTFIHSLNLKNYIDWQKYISGSLPNLSQLPENIPAKPNLIYKNIGWVDWESWLGNQNSNLNLSYKSYDSPTLENDLEEIYNKINSENNVSETTYVKEEKLKKEDISIDALLANKEISQRAYNICEDNALLTLGDIIHHYIKHNTFQMFRNCGWGIEAELQTLVQKHHGFLNQLNLPEDTNSEKEREDITTKYLYTYRKLSKRAYYLCKYHDLLTVKDIERYYLKNKTFLNYRNCGKGTDNELRSTVQNYSNLSFQDQFDNEGDTENTNIHEIPNLRISLEEIKIRFNLSIRAYNILLAHDVQDSKQLIQFNNRIQGDILSLRNCGTKTADEISELVKKVVEIDGTNEILTNKQVLHDDFFEVKQMLVKINSDNYDEIDRHTSDYSNNEFKLFTFINFLLHNYLKDKEYIIIKSRIIGDSEDKKSLQELGDELNLTRERIRQIEQAKSAYIIRKARAVLNQIPDLINHLTYSFDLSKEYIYIDQGFKEEVERKESLNIRLSFIIDILSIILKDYFKIASHKNKTFFISNKYDYFKFDKLIKYLTNIYSEKISKDFTIQLNSLLPKYFKSGAYKSYFEIERVCLEIIIRYFNIYPEEDGLIIFKKNDRKILPEFIEEVLEEEGKPIELQEIFNRLNEKYPGLAKNTHSILRFLYQNPRIIHIGRSSTFMLIDWENEMKYKGGTIRDLVYNFLKENNKMAHIDEIYEYVSQFRQTNIKSLLYNIKLDKSNRFIEYSDGYLGIR